MNSFPDKSSPIRISGRKSRPTCVVIAVRDAKDGLTHLALLVVTTQPPQSDRGAIEVPDTEARRAGLSDPKRCWVMIDEYNYDIAERSWYIEPMKTFLADSVRRS